MRRHQVLTGAVNPGNHCFSVGTIASFTFWAYGSGCDLVILGVDLQPIHIIPGHIRGYKLITCLDCCQFCGKIAVSYGHEIVIYRPKLIKNANNGVPVFTWVEEATLSLDENIGPATVLSWASTGQRLLVGCKEILLWEVQNEVLQKEPKRQTLKVQFSIEEIEEEDENDSDDFSEENTQKDFKWGLVWHSGIEENPCDVQFSPDDTLFASISRGDSMIKVWHQRTALPMHLFQDSNKKQNGGGRYQNAMSSSSHMNHFDIHQSSLPSSAKLDFTFTYLIHPKPVAGFSWRKGVPLLPNGTMPNVLISSCRDNMCRIWCETLTPDTDVTKLASDHATVQPKYSIGRKRAMPQSEKNASTVPVKKSVSAPMIDHSIGYENVTEVPRKPTPRMFRHFHIAATINPTSDIPLLPSISAMDSCVDGTVDEDDSRGPLVFTVHWLDNKHHHAMAHLNKILHEAMADTKSDDTTNMKPNAMKDDSRSVNSMSSDSTIPSIKSPSRQPSPLKRPSGFAAKFPVWDSKRPESVDAFLSCLASPVSPDVQSDLGLSLPGNVYDILRSAWVEQSDALFAIHPTDGSLLVWHVNYLDENRCGQIRQAQVSFSSRIPMAIPARDASTLCSRLVLYANHYSAHLSFNKTTDTPSSNPQKPQDVGAPEPTDQEFIATDGHASPSISLLSKHSDGSLNQWEVVFSSSAVYSTVSSITHRSRFCGHRYHLSDIFCHPTLPLLLSTSHHHDQSSNTNKQRSMVRSELIMWRVDPVGPLCHTGGVTELARLNGPLVDDFSKVAWFPVLFPSWCLGPANSSPSTCFISLHNNSLHVYQAVIDAQEILDCIDIPGDICTKQGQVGCVASQQSSSHPGCLLFLDSITVGSEVSVSDAEILLMSVFSEEQFFESTKSKSGEHVSDDDHSMKKHGIMETFFLVFVQKSKTIITVRTWKISFTANLNSVSGARTRRATAVAVSDDSSEDYSDDDNKNENNSGINDFKSISFLNVTSTELPSQVLVHPVGENIKMACAATDPFSLSVFHHIQVLPYSVLTTSDSGRVYFWRGTRRNSEFINQKESITWLPWNANSSVIDIAPPQIDIGGSPLVVKMAHCCMLACLSTTDVKGGYLCHASIYECVSSGGAIWRLQDRLLVGTVDFITAKQVHLDWLSREDGTFLLTVSVGRKVKVYAQLPIGMQWEDRTDPKLSETDVKRRDSGGPSIRPLLKRKSTLDVLTRQKLLGSYKSGKSFDGGSLAQCTNDCNHLLRWSLLSEISLGNSTGLSATHDATSLNLHPVMVSWVRDGLLLVATDTEMHVFCHWMEKTQCGKSAPPNSGILYGSASLSHSVSEGLCQYLMQEPQDGLEISFNTPVVSLMSVADSLCPCLPQYHPLVLSELTNGGHLDHVKHILINLASAINRQFEPKDGIIQVEPMHLKKFSLTVDDDGEDSEQKTHYLAPVLLFDLLDENGRINEKSFASTHEKPRNATPSAIVSTRAQNSKQQEKSDYDDLFSNDLLENEENELNLELDDEKHPASEDSIDLTQFEPGYLGSEHCQVLHNYLSRNLLPGLNSHDQMELMAIADTVANAVDSKVSSDDNVGVGVDGGGRGYATSGNTATESMDQCGMRFVFAMHNHLCLLRSLPAPQRAKLLHQGLESCHFAWAFHSDAEEEMLSLISSVQRGAPEWDELRSFGAGWWIRSTPTLRRLIEQTARAAFQKDNNPLDAAIFYMALNKKNVLKGLFKSVREERMMQFFSQDFTEERWHRAALKNAFALMGKQRFQEAAAFFLLANSVNDAIEICIDKMDDLQLAFIIVRLYEQDRNSTAHSEFLREHVLGEKQNIKTGKERKILPDTFIRSMAHWQLGSYDESLKTLIDNQRSSNEDCLVNITDVFNFYNFLRQHPLIMRQKKIDQSQAVSTTDQQIDDSITQEERMLFFATAASHLDAGCPLLTLDVLSSLPPLRDEDSCDGVQVAESTDKADDLFATDEYFDNSDMNIGTSAGWGEPTDLSDLATSFDENIKDELELDWSEEESDSESEKIEDRPRINITTPTPLKKEIVEIKKEPVKTEVKKSKALYSDIYAHQLRLMACLKIFVSELKSLAMTYHADDGQIREQLYSWLEKETEVLHRISPQSYVKSPSAKLSDSGTNGTDKSQKSEFSSGSESDGEQKISFRRTEGESPAGGGSLKPAPSLHELYLTEKQDWKTRRELACHRRRWLRQHRRFLRTLLSYCGLHDDAQGSLAPLRMELLFLLQDSLQERTPHQLSSPVPNPTSVPLLSSSTVACRTVVAEPTARLTHMAQDILSTLLTFSDPPPYLNWTGSQLPTVVLCRQAEALSHCIYLSLCDTNSKTYRARLLDNDRSNTPETLFSSSVASGTGSEYRYVPPSTQPSQWPGVVSLQALLNMDSGDNRPKLIVLLCESLIAIYVSLLVHGLQTCNSLLLYRLISNQLSEKTWNAVFGGGAKVVVKYSRPMTVGSPGRPMHGSKVRDKLNRKVLSYSFERRGSFTSSNSTDTTSYREKFVAPEITLWDYLLSKPLMTFLGADEVSFESDSDMETDDNNTFSDDDSLDEFGEPKQEVKVTEHGDPNSYSWHIIRLAVVRALLQNLKTFLPTTGLELSELGTSSPMLNSILQMLSQWQITFVKDLESFNEIPTEYIKGIQGTGTGLRGRPAILKHQAMLDPNNTPFSGVSVEALGARRLWHCLVRRENLQELFIHYIFQKKSLNATVSQPPPPKKMSTRRATIAVISPDPSTSNQQFSYGAAKTGMGIADGRIGKVKILHKETEIISSFCINKANPNCVVLATSRDVQEIDVSVVLASDSCSWVEEDISTNLLQEEIQKTTTQKDEDFHVVSRRQSMFVHPNSQTQQIPSTSPGQWSGSAQTGQGATVLLKRSFSGVRRMASHPTLPYYLTGHHDGSVRMWEWGHQQQISLFRNTGQFPKVTNLHFSSLGNKIAVVDADGFLALWQVSSPKKPFIYHQCHDRSAADCCFMSSTSVIATAGLSANNRNVAIWDTLLPPRSMLVKDFTVHEGVGATCVCYAAQHRTLVVGGRDGKVSIFDLRRPDDPLHCYSAHEAPIKCIGLSTDDKLFVTGSVVGDVRLWDINSHLLAYNLNGEHARTSIFRNYGSGTMKVQIAAPGNRVFSCGADGTLKLRILPHDPEKDFGLGNSIGSRIHKLTLQKQVVKLANAIRGQCLAY